MTQPFEYKSEEWYHEISEKVVSIFDGKKYGKRKNIGLFIMKVE